MSSESTNKALSRIFSEMASVMELTGANPFRVNAHVRVARILKELNTDVATLADDEKKLTAIEGIGGGSARKIIEFVKTGSVQEHQELLDEVPRGLLEVMRIPGLGPKTVKMLWEQAEVTDMDSLRKALDSGAVEALPRMGAKSVANIREAIQFVEKSSERFRLGMALPIAELIVQYLQQVEGTSHAAYAGSLRRGAETIGDIDVLACTTEAQALAEAFLSLHGVEKVLAGGPTKCSVRLEPGIQVDLRIVEEPGFGAALMYFTGSKAHNVVLRERAVKRKLRLNEYGLFPDDGEDEPPQQRGVAPVAAATEEEIYQHLELPYIPPELREDRGELGGDIPKLIRLEDIKAELHAHTVASDGRLTIEQLAREAKSRGFHTIAVTDHSRSSVQANGLSVERLREHIEAVRAADAEIKGITILAGSEVDIHADGTLDYEDELLAELDIVVASPHSALRQDRATATRRLVQAISHPLVNILGHPTGRQINRREGLDPDISKLVEAALEHDTALEINSNFMRLDLRDVHVREAVEAGALLAVDTDAHTVDDFDHLRYGIMTARRGWLTAKQCVNTWSKKKLVEWLGKKG